MLNTIWIRELKIKKQLIKSLCTRTDRKVFDGFDPVGSAKLMFLPKKIIYFSSALIDLFEPRQHETEK